MPDKTVEILDLVNNKYSARTVIKNRIIAGCNNFPNLSCSI